MQRTLSVPLRSSASTAECCSACRAAGDSRLAPGFDQDCKYNLKKRKSYISCLPEAGGASVTRQLPLKVSGKSLHGLFSSIGSCFGTGYRFGGSSPEGFDCSGFAGFHYEKKFPHAPATDMRRARTPLEVRGLARQGS
ncbi:MAG: C40 family peptidase [Chlorobiaceae bacterium]|nr:C40 family peptidase [Chlorobiaceae bacterium]